jgi:hypothetical protein
MEKQRFRIAKDNFDGTEETIWSKICTKEEADTMFLKVVQEQSHEYRVTKTLPRWRQIRLYNQNEELIATES